MKIKLYVLRELINEGVNQLIGSNDLGDKHETLRWALEASGALIIPSGGNPNGRLGVGVSGSVFEVLHQGQRRAMKVSNDAVVYQQLMNKFKEISPDARRALPIIYDVIIHGKNNRFGATIMELLQPLTKGDFTLSFGFRRGIEDNSVFALGAELQRVGIKNWSDWLDEAVRETLEYVDAEQLNNLKSDIRNDINIYKSKEKLPYDVILLFSTHITSLLRSVFGRKLSDTYKKISMMALTGHEELQQGVNKHSGMGQLDPEMGGSRAVSQLYKRLNALASEGIEWADVHKGNLMMRPHTGELVVADVGEFQFRL